MSRPAAIRFYVILLSLAGFALTLRLFYPGIQTFDAGYVYDAIHAERLGDWQSPAMTLIWAAIDPIAPGSASMFLLVAASYWTAFGLVGTVLARWSRAAALSLPLLALAPPAFTFVGVIWRDMLFAVFWSLAAALAFAVAGQRRTWRAPGQVAALGLVALGVLLRPNAVVAAPLLAAYVVWPMRFAWKRAALFAIPAAAASALLIQVVYYGVLDAKRQNPLHQVFVFDLGGITHFTKKNQFPVDWTPEQTRLLIESCYQPAAWDSYWFLDPCRFVMERLEGQVFGSPVLVRAWRDAILSHPFAYLRHRAAFFWTFLAGANLTLPLDDLQAEHRTAFLRDPWFQEFLAMHQRLEKSALFRVGLWTFVQLGICLLAWPRRDTPPGAFAIGVSTCALAYLLTFAVVGIAADFRYAYWLVLAALTATPVVAVSQASPNLPENNRVRA